MGHWSRKGFVRCTLRDDINQRNTHVEAQAEVSQDRGSIPLASIKTPLAKSSQVAFFLIANGTLTDTIILRQKP